MLDQPYMTDLIEANSMGHEPNLIDIYSASWGPTDDGKTVDGPRNATMRAIVKGVNEVTVHFFVLRFQKSMILQVSFRVDMDWVTFSFGRLEMEVKMMTAIVMDTQRACGLFPLIPQLTTEKMRITMKVAVLL